MSRLSVNLVFVVALLASGSCLAQDAGVASSGGAAPSLDASPDADPAAAQAQKRSAFGKVMAIMISSLKRQQAQAGTKPAAPVRTSASGTPLGIEVGEAFRVGAAEAAPAPAASDTPSGYAVAAPALAGTD